MFSLEANEEVAWCLTVNTYGVDEESKDYLSVYRGLLSCPESPVLAKLEFWIINSQGEKCQSMKNHNVVTFQQYEKWGFKKFILRGFLLSHQQWLVPADQLSLCCKLSLVGAIFSMPGQKVTPTIKDLRQMLTDDLAKLWEKSLFTDYSLLVGGHVFRAHNAILAACSPVLRAMFEH